MKTKRAHQATATGSAALTEYLFRERSPSMGEGWEGVMLTATQVEP
jgi:hypothetical protein